MSQTNITNFDAVKVGDEVNVCFRPMHFQEEGPKVKGVVTEVSEQTISVRYLADVYRAGEFRKSDGKSITEDDDFGWIERI